MGIWGDQFEGRHVIGLSGHKSENTIKQYVTRIPTAKKREMFDALATNILPKAPRKSKEPTATISVPPEEPIVQVQLDEEAENQESNNENAVNDQQLQQFVFEEMNAPLDPALENFLKSFDTPQENLAPHVPLQQVQNMPVQMPQQIPHNVKMNVQNVQNVNPHALVPAMYFAPNSNVTINYNFNK